MPVSNQTQLSSLILLDKEVPTSSVKTDGHIKKGDLVLYHSALLAIVWAPNLLGAEN